MDISYVVVYSAGVFPRISAIQLENKGYEKSGWTFEEAKEEMLKWVEEQKEEIIGMTEGDLE